MDLHFALGIPGRNFATPKQHFRWKFPEYLCGCAHSVCERLLHKECAVSVRAEKYQVCSVRKFVQMKKLKIQIYLKPKPLNVFYGGFSDSKTNLGVIWHHTCISCRAFYFWGPGELCGCGCGKISKKHTRAVWECAEQKAIVRRVCGCAKIGCTQILWS